MTNLGDCHDLYAQIDKLLLTDIFGSFKDTFLKNMILILLVYI